MHSSSSSGASALHHRPALVHKSLSPQRLHPKLRPGAGKLEASLVTQAAAGGPDEPLGAVELRPTSELPAVGAAGQQGEAAVVGGASVAPAAREAVAAP